MAWASTDIVPAALNLQPSYSATANSVLNDITVKLVPRTSSGAIFDCTAATGCNLDYCNNPTLPATGQLFTNLTPTIVAADATGITIKIAKADLATAQGVIGTLTPKVYLHMTDGTTVLAAAIGSLNTQIVA